MIDCFCLCCQKSLRKEEGIINYFYINDVICHKCRRQLVSYHKSIRIDNFDVEVYYPYSDFVREQIIQYKEKKDEALFPIFLYPFINDIKTKYKGYTLVPLPSSKENIEIRGFKHVEKMFSLLNMDMIETFEKTENIDQKKQKYAQRSNISQVIKLKENLRIYDKKILLIDDVVTTGQTMKSCYKLLEGRCKMIKCLSISYNERYLKPLEKALFLLEKR